MQENIAEKVQTLKIPHFVMQLTTSARRDKRGLLARQEVLQQLAQQRLQVLLVQLAYLEAIVLVMDHHPCVKWAMFKRLHLNLPVPSQLEEHIQMLEVQQLLKLLQSVIGLYRLVIFNKQSVTMVFSVMVQEL